MGALDHVQLRRVGSFDQLAECRRWVGERRSGPLFFDTESGGLSPYRDRHRMTQLGDLNMGWAFPVAWTGAAAEILRDYRGELGAHNSPYDWQVLQQHAGLAPRFEATHDTELSCRIVDSVRLAALKPRAAVDIDSRAIHGEEALEAGMRAQHWTWDTVPDDWDPYWCYGALDPVLSAHLWHKHKAEVLGSFPAVYDLERATARICAGMMRAGMMLDIPYIEANIAERRAFYDQAMSWLRSRFGLTTVNSNEQVGAALERAGVPTLVRTETGLPSLSKDTLRLYAGMFPDQAPMIRTIAICRKTAKVVNDYLEKFLRLAGSDGIMHYSIHTCQARTSRQSVTDPPMQTYDRDEPIVRGSFIPRPGMVFISIDADQIEARLGAHLSGDERMIADFLEADATGQSFFVLGASRIFGEEITKKDPRYTHTKNATYGQIYGAGLEKAAATAGVPVEQMRPVYVGIQERYPGLGRWMAQLIRQGKAGGRPQVRTLMGRRLYADRGHEYALANYQDQGSAAEIMKAGQVRLDQAGFGPYLRLDVHDEILMEVPREYAQEMLAEASRILTDRENFRVPITWSGSILEDRWRKA